MVFINLVSTKIGTYSNMFKYNLLAYCYIIPYFCLDTPSPFLILPIHYLLPISFLSIGTDVSPTHPPPQRYSTSIYTSKFIFHNVSYNALFPTTMLLIRHITSIRAIHCPLSCYTLTYIHSQSIYTLTQTSPLVPIALENPPCP